MTRHQFAGMLAAAVLLGGCEPRAAPEIEERAAEPDAAQVGYDPDTLGWFQEGRPVEFEEREWRPVGEAVFERRGSLERVGEFEGMALYAPADERPPYAHLFFPYGSEIWQPLEPIEADGEEP
jgi:hypothetical protein